EDAKEKLQDVLLSVKDKLSDVKEAGENFQEKVSSSDDKEKSKNKRKIKGVNQIKKATDIKSSTKIKSSN
ncbi:gas vesicle protein GvpQ, partial [Priestia megaterium]